MGMSYSLLAIKYWLLAVGFWLLATGYWLLAIGDWLLAIGFWLLAVGVWLLAICVWRWAITLFGLVLGAIKGWGCEGRRPWVKHVKQGGLGVREAPQWLGGWSGGEDSQ